MKDTLVDHSAQGQDSNHCERTRAKYAFGRSQSICQCIIATLEDHSAQGQYSYQCECTIAKDTLKDHGQFVHTHKVMHLIIWNEP